jgi:hypothetical protein
MSVPGANHQAMLAECHRAVIGVSRSVQDAQGSDRKILRLACAGW